MKSPFFDAFELGKCDAPCVMAESAKDYRKTSSILAYLLWRFLETGQKTIYLTRYANQFDLFAGTNEEGALRTLNDKMGIKLHRIYVKPTGLFYEKEPDKPIQWGMLASIKNANNFKQVNADEYSYIFMDEFQTQTGNYIKGEFEKFLLIASTVKKRAGFSCDPDFKIFMACNTVSVLNPYYKGWGLLDTLDFGKDTIDLVTKAVYFWRRAKRLPKETDEPTPFDNLVAGTDFEKFMHGEIYIDDYDFLITDKELNKQRTRSVASCEVTNGWVNFHDAKTKGVMLASFSENKLCKTTIELNDFKIFQKKMRGLLLATPQASKFIFD